MTSSLKTMSRETLLDLETTLNRELELTRANRMSLDLSRGKPAVDQLRLSDTLEDAIGGNYIAADGTDTRNYGNLRGLPEARALGGELLGVPAELVIAGGNSSLTLMHHVVSTALSTGLWEDSRKWSNSAQPAVLTPVPGYDRHFTLSEALGIEMVNIPIGDDGPDMDAAEALVQENPDIKGIWCVPKYSNPTGCTYSDEVVRRMAELPLKAAADDFVILWDNAYAVHDLSDPPDRLTSLYEAARQAGTENHAVQFASTSKITFAGAGVGFVSSGATVLDALEATLSASTIGPDKVNQLRHARFLGGRLADHMQAHAELLRPKFDIVLDTLENELAALDIATWTHPRGGYFVSLDLNPGLAAEVVELAKSVGLTLTPAGATYPYGHDPEDKNVRIAPTFADLEELKSAMHVLTLCVKLASVQQQLEETG